MNDLKILSFNVRGLNDEMKRCDVFSYLQTQKNDIYCIQDTHCTSKSEFNFRKNWGSKVYHSYGTSRSRGVAIMFGQNIDSKVLNVVTDRVGNYIIMHMQVLETEFCIVNIYGPNADEPDFYTNLFDIVAGFETSTIVICGDWNMVLDQKLDTKHYVRDNNIRARQRVLVLKTQFDLQDPWRVNNPEKNEYTWRKNSWHSGKINNYRSNVAYCRSECTNKNPHPSWRIEMYCCWRHWFTSRIEKRADLYLP